MCVRAPDVAPRKRGPECRQARFERAGTVWQRPVIGPAHVLEQRDGRGCALPVTRERAHPRLDEQQCGVLACEGVWKTVEPREDRLVAPGARGREPDVLDRAGGLPIIAALLRMPDRFVHQAARLMPGA